MCFPCWPWADVYLEEVPKKKENSVVVWDPNAKSMVRLTGVKPVSSIFLLLLALYLPTWESAGPIVISDSSFTLHPRKRAPHLDISLFVNKFTSTELNFKPTTSNDPGFVSTSTLTNDTNQHDASRKLPTASSRHDHRSECSHLYPTRRWLYCDRRGYIPSTNCRCCNCC
jgi:hypothetical protein